jgi:dolichol-phosphate mannosyltransferase
MQVPIADPMSGFFMLRRETFQKSMRRLSSIGFKILLDIFASSPRPLQVKEIPFQAFSSASVILARASLMH